MGNFSHERGTPVVHIPHPAKGRRALLRTPSTEGRSVCLCWAPSKPQRPRGRSAQRERARLGTLEPFLMLEGNSQNAQMTVAIQPLPPRGQWLDGDSHLGRGRAVTTALLAPLPPAVRAGRSVPESGPLVVWRPSRLLGGANVDRAPLAVTSRNVRTLMVDHSSEEKEET